MCRDLPLNCWWGHSISRKVRLKQMQHACGTSQRINEALMEYIFVVQCRDHYIFLFSLCFLMTLVAIFCSTYLSETIFYYMLLALVFLFSMSVAYGLFGATKKFSIGLIGSVYFDDSYGHILFNKVVWNSILLPIVDSYLFSKSLAYVTLVSRFSK